MSTHVYGTAGEGVVVQQIQRIHSDAYDALFRGASSSANYYTTQQNSLKAIQANLGDPNSGIATQYSQFQSAIAALVSQASGGQTATARAAVLTQAQALASSLNNAANAISQQKAQTLQQDNARFPRCLPPAPS